MFSILGVCNGNFTAAAREYALGYPFRRHPNKNVSVRLNQLLRETGNIAQMIDNHDKGRPRTTRTSRVEEQVIDITKYKSTRCWNSLYISAKNFKERKFPSIPFYKSPSFNTKRFSIPDGSLSVAAQEI